MTTLSLAEVRRIAGVRAPWCVTVYADAEAWRGSDPPSEAAARQIRLAVHGLMDAAAPDQVIADVRGHLEAVASSGDPAAAAQGRRIRSMGIFATSAQCDVFGLPTIHEPRVAVSDRFEVGPLVDGVLALAPRVFVLAASENSARLVDVTARPVRVIDVTRPAADPQSVGGDRRSRAYAEALIRHVTPVVRHAGAMLAIVAPEPLASMLEAEVILHSDVPSQILPLAPESSAPDEITADQLASLAASVVVEQKERARQAEASRLSDVDPLLALRDIASVEAAVLDGTADALSTDVDAPASGLAT